MVNYFQLNIVYFRHSFSCKKISWCAIPHISVTIRATSFIFQLQLFFASSILMVTILIKWLSAQSVMWPITQQMMLATQSYWPIEFERSMKAGTY